MSDPSAVHSALREVVEGSVLADSLMEAALEEILGGRAPDVLVAGLAVALRMRGETPDELAAAARVLRRHAEPLPLSSRPVLLDTCGTGGDGAETFNISTATAIVVAACGVPVAKHGNRAVSSRCGSADVLEAFGIVLKRAIPAEVDRTLSELSIAFLFAPGYHSALRHAAPVRRALSVRTFFNLLGPLANPAGATHQLLGVYERAKVRPMAEVLSRLGSTGAWVVHGEGGLDEVSPVGATHVAVLAEGLVQERVVEPADFGLAAVSFEGLRGGDARTNASIIRSVLSGEPGPPRTAVVINAAVALLVAGMESDPRAAAERATAAIDTGAAAHRLTQWVAA